MSHHRPPLSLSRRLSMFSDESASDLPVPDYVRAAVFPPQVATGFVAVPGMPAAAVPTSAAALYAWAQETARAQVCEQRAARLAPRWN